MLPEFSGLGPAFWPLPLTDEHTNHQVAYVKFRCARSVKVSKENCTLGGPRFSRGCPGLSSLEFYKRGFQLRASLIESTVYYGACESRFPSTSLRAGSLRLRRFGMT